MISKTRIGVILSSVMVASAMVCFGVGHRHHQSVAASIPVNPHVEQIPAIPKPRAGKPLDTPADDSQADATNNLNAAAQQSSDASNNPNQNQAAAGGHANGSDSDLSPTASVTVQQLTASYAAAPVRVHPVAKARVVNVARPVVAATSFSVDRPLASVASALPSAVVVPRGTEFTLRLVEPLGSKISHANQSFAAILDRDIEIRGFTVIPAGARATGKVVFARLAGRFAGEANLQLEIDSIKINRHEFAVRTSIRSFGPMIQAKNKVGRFMKGIAKRIDGEEHDVLLADQTAYTFNLSRPLEIQ